MPADVLSLRAVNRALLSRQLLLDRRSLPAAGPGRAAQVVRIALMRGTIHLVSARDCLPVRRLVQPVLERGMRGAFGKQLAGVDPAALAAAGRSGLARHTSAEHWLGQPVQPPWQPAEPAAGTAPAELVTRYLGAFGPATARDVQAWSGLTGLKAVLERLRPSLVTFRDEQGAELFDLPGAPRPGAVRAHARARRAGRRGRPAARVLRA